MKNKDQILLEEVYSKLIRENKGYTIQSGSGSKQSIDEIRIGNDLYGVEFDVDLKRSVEDTGTYYDEPNIEILSVFKYDPQIDDSIQISLDKIDPQLLQQIENKVLEYIDDMLENDRIDFYDDEPYHPDI